MSALLCLQRAFLPKTSMRLNRRKPEHFGCQYSYGENRIFLINLSIWTLSIHASASQTFTVHLLREELTLSVVVMHCSFICFR